MLSTVVVAVNNFTTELLSCFFVSTTESSSAPLRKAKARKGSEREKESKEICGREKSKWNFEEEMTRMWMKMWQQTRQRLKSERVKKYEKKYKID